MLRNKINLYTTVMFIVLLIFINGAIYFTFSTMTLDNALEKTRADAERIITGINRTGTSLSTTDLLHAFVPTDGMLQIVKMDGKSAAGVAVAEQKNLRQQPVYFIKKKLAKS